MPNLQIDAVVPMLCVTLAALAAMAGEALRGKGPRMPVGWFGIIGLVGAAVSAVILWNPTPEAFREDFGVIVADNFGLFVTLVLALVGILTIMFSSQVIHRDNLPAGEYYALLLFSIVGMMMMATATDLLVIFVALEILSLAVYVLTGIRREDQAGTEAAFKYFLLGAFSSAFFLYGIAFTYGVTGSTRLSAITQYLSAQSMSGDPMMLIALGLLLVGFAFKISAVPFHMWTPDAYEGAPAIVTGFMSTGVKAAAFAAFARVFLSSFEPFRDLSAAARLGAGRGGDCRGDDDPRHGRRRGAEQSEAHARLFEHRARRLPAGGPGGRQLGGQGGDPLLPAGVFGDQPGGVRRDRAARLARPRQRQLRDYAGLWHSVRGWPR